MNQQAFIVPGIILLESRLDCDLTYHILYTPISPYAQRPITHIVTHVHWWDAAVLRSCSHSRQMEQKPQVSESDHTMRHAGLEVNQTTRWDMQDWRHRKRQDRGIESSRALIDSRERYLKIYEVWFDERVCKWTSYWLNLISNYLSAILPLLCNEFK